MSTIVAALEKLKRANEGVSHGGGSTDLGLQVLIDEHFAAEAKMSALPTLGERREAARAGAVGHQDRQVDPPDRYRQRSGFRTCAFAHRSDAAAFRARHRRPDRMEPRSGLEDAPRGRGRVIADSGLTWAPGSKRARRGKAAFDDGDDVTAVAVRVAEKISKSVPGPGEPRSDVVFAAVQAETINLVAGGAAEMALLGDAPPEFIASDMLSANAVAGIICRTPASRAAFIEHCY
jgi:hypothetical protein